MHRCIQYTYLPTYLHTYIHTGVYIYIHMHKQYQWYNIRNTNANIMWDDHLGDGPTSLRSILKPWEVSEHVKMWRFDDVKDASVVFNLCYCMLLYFSPFCKIERGGDWSQWFAGIFWQQLYSIITIITISNNHDFLSRGNTDSTKSSNDNKNGTSYPLVI